MTRTYLLEVVLVVEGFRFFETFTETSDRKDPTKLR